MRHLFCIAYMPHVPYEKYLVIHAKNTINITNTAITNMYQLVHDENNGGLLFISTGFLFIGIWLIGMCWDVFKC